MMPPHEGLLVVNRLELFRLADRAGVLGRRSPSVALTAELVFRRYRGFDGTAWPELKTDTLRLEAGLAPIEELNNVQRHLSELPTRVECDLIALSRTDGLRQRLSGLGWRRVGIDVGYYDSEWAHYSILLNEVLWGSHASLRSLSSMLNEDLLLDTIIDGEQALAAREKVAAEGADVERVGNFSIIEVHVPPLG